MAKSKRPIQIAEKLRLKRIPTQLVHLPDRPGRHASVYEEGAFSELCHSVSKTGGNVTPILVQPRTVEEGVSDGYVLLSGERRWRACQKANVEVWALILTGDHHPNLVGILSLHENTNASNYSPLEFGLVCQYVLKQGLFKNQTALALELGRSESLISQSLSVADLPLEVVQAFASVTDIQYRHAKPLKKALREDREAVLARAKSASESLPEDCKPQKIVAYLCGKLDGVPEEVAEPGDAGESKSSTVEDLVVIKAPLIAKGKTLGMLKITEAGHLRIDFEAAFSHVAVDVHEDLKSAIEAVVERWLPERDSANPADAKAVEIAEAL